MRKPHIDPVEIVAISVPVIVELVVVLGFIAAIFIWGCVLSGRLPPV